jgi:hypothetical protein
VKSNASEVLQTVLDSPKVAAVTAAGTTTVGGASLFLQLQDWVSFLAAVIGLMLSIVLLITHTINLRNKLLATNMKRRSDDVNEDNANRDG